MGAAPGTAPRSETCFPNNVSRSNITIPACQPPYSCSRDISAAPPTATEAQETQETKQSDRPIGGDSCSGMTHTVKPVLREFQTHFVACDVF